MANERTIREVLNDSENVEIRSHVVDKDEFIMSGLEVGYTNEEVMAKRKVLNRGRIEILETLTLKGVIKNEGVIRIGGV